MMFFHSLVSAKRVYVSLLHYPFPSPCVNFINVLRAAFTCADPKSAKKTVKSSSFLALSGSASVKAARRMLMKLTPSLFFSLSLYVVMQKLSQLVSVALQQRSTFEDHNKKSFFPPSSTFLLETFTCADHKSAKKDKVKS